jgi:hypothetical protein
MYQESWVWWCMPIIPALGRRKQEDQEFKSSLGYIARLSFKKKERRKKKWAKDK